MNQNVDNVIHKVKPNIGDTKLKIWKKVLQIDMV